MQGRATRRSRARPKQGQRAPDFRTAVVAESPFSSHAVSRLADPGLRPHLQSSPRGRDRAEPGDASRSARHDPSRRPRAPPARRPRSCRGHRLICLRRRRGPRDRPRPRRGGQGDGAAARGREGLSAAGAAGKAAAPSSPPRRRRWSTPTGPTGRRWPVGAGVPDAACEWIGACGRRFDGGETGGLAGDLPLEARVVQVACECDGLMASRPRATGASGGDRGAALRGGDEARPGGGREPRGDPRTRRIESSAPCARSSPRPTRRSSPS